MTDKKKTDYTEEEAMSLLIRVADARMELENINISWNGLHDEIIPEDVKVKLSELDDEFRPKMEQAKARMNELEEQLRDAIVSVGHTIKGLRIQGVYVAPKSVWDGEKLEGYAVAHPDILALKTMGEAGAQIRKVETNNNRKSHR